LGVFMVICRVPTHFRTGAWNEWRAGKRFSYKSSDVCYKWLMLK